MKKYTLEIFIDEKDGIGVHEKTDGLNIMDARLIISVLEEYKGRMLAYITLNQQLEDRSKKEAIKAE